MARHYTSDLERERIKLYLALDAGFTYDTIARYVYGKNHADSDTARIGVIAREENLSPMPYRHGESKNAKRLLSHVEGPQQRRYG